MMIEESAFATRERIARQIQAAFTEAELGTHFANDKRKPYAEVPAYHNFDAGGQRRFIIRVWDDGMCRVHMSRIMQIPKGMGDWVDVGDLPILLELPCTAAEIGSEIRRRTRQASLEDSETVPATLLDRQREPPIPVGQLETVAELIQAFHDQYRSETYSRALQSCPERAGTVFHPGRREEWFITETDRMAYRRMGENETSTGLDANSIKLTAIIPELC